jgi:hypothetical protein
LRSRWDKGGITTVVIRGIRMGLGQGFVAYKMVGRRRLELAWIRCRNEVIRQWEKIESADWVVG